ncbi:hypothetical protein GOODEAATRI_011102 [Goodea atripinnis]|uniref:Uncharacterized protein n=1 Tax=Goodea atripinnis TaxID=208336 RepID=A0ABV0MR76_9TELE
MQTNRHRDGEWEISAFDSKLRSRGMSIRYTVRACNDGEFSLVDHNVDEDISDYYDNIFQQPRGLRPQNGTMLVRVCKKPVTNNTTLSKDVGPLCELRRMSVASVRREQVPEDAGIPEDVLEKVERDGGWRAAENPTGAEENRGGRQKREAGGNRTGSNGISLTAEESARQKVQSEDLISPEEDMGENYIYSESEGLSDELLDLEYNITDGNTTQLNLSFEYDDYNSEVRVLSICLNQENFQTSKHPPHHY